MRLKPYGRILQIILGFIGVCTFPGIFLSVPILIYMLSSPTAVLFSQKNVSQLTNSEIETLSRLPKLTRIIGIVIGCMIALTIISSALFIGFPEATDLINQRIGSSISLRLANDKKKAKMTMADMRAIGTACEAFEVDNNFFPDATNLEELAKLIEPVYIKKLPLMDAWENRFEYRAWKDSETGENMRHYMIISLGNDKYPDGSDYKAERSTANFSDDIVYSEGSFLHFPTDIHQ